MNLQISEVWKAGLSTPLAALSPVEMHNVFVWIYGYGCVAPISALQLRVSGKEK